ncbi:MAG: hypothetical protein ACK4L8_02915 [Nitrincola lacisaponensis]|uniref:Putative lipoprotein n=1 Tax=Nitrincola lacisaponensis TaxID=267850 RepID=A0A063Y5Y7_9GAMM|nr:hypothetical protein [Nitrincola lacisaponensis]KDE40540.1 putative lipoprotein [Nitrincola lacisaponensis]
MQRAQVLRVLLIGLLLTGCTGPQPSDRPFRIQNLAKTDIDMVADAHVEETTRLLRELTVKLYHRNPRELRKAPSGTTIEMRLQQLFDKPRQLSHPELYYRYGVDAVPLAFDEAFDGDRVFALMVGISGMLHASYHYRDEFFMLSELDQQRLHDSARNLEIIVWRLSNRKMTNGELFLLSNGISPDGVQNLSFERLFGKLIAHQDMMARIISDKTNRGINKAVISVATATLIPI